MTTTTTTINTPRVWIGCLHCYNAGRLVGEWFDCTESADVDLDAVHAGQPGTLTPICEEMWCFDTDSVPVPGEMDPLHAAAWGETYEEVGETLWPAYSAWVRSGTYVERAAGTGASEDFEERYCGRWDSFQEYADDYVDSTGLCGRYPSLPPATSTTTHTHAIYSTTTPLLMPSVAACTSSTTSNSYRLGRRITSF